MTNTEYPLEFYSTDTFLYVCSN